MSPQESSATRIQRLPIFQLALFALLAAVCAVGLASGTAQSPQDGAATPAQEEREFKNTVPAHVPLKVKVKNEKSFKDVKNKNWFREMEIEVRNTGNKPIYYLYVLVEMPEVIVQGYPLGVQLTYGRKELLFIDTPVRSDDVPILPGESLVLTIPKSMVGGYERTRDRENRSDPKKVEFELQFMNFGDGTGLQGADGRPALAPARKKVSGASPLRGGAALAPSALSYQESVPSGSLVNAINQPAFVRANFSERDSAPYELLAART